MKQILSVILALLIATYALSQTNLYERFSIRPYELIPPPPTAGELGKYVEIPVSKYTGVPSISIPLYQINTNNYNMDISLSYHASGIKVQQRASWVGLGWSLNAGGLITRTVRGLPDDQDTTLVVETGQRCHIAPVGRLYSDPAGRKINFSSPNEYDKNVDTESDIFYFNFNGYSGSFIFDENKIPRITDGSPLKIDYSLEYKSLYSTDSRMLLASFTITTPDGNRYIFSSPEVTNNIPMTASVYDYPEYSLLLHSIFVTKIRSYSSYISSWYLSRIEFPNTQEKIELKYDEIKYNYLERIKISNIRGCFAGIDVTCEDIRGNCGNNCGNRLEYIYSHTLVNGLTLSKIIWSNGSVSFTPSTIERKDILTNTAIQKGDYQNFEGKEKSLAQIAIKDNQNHLIKKFDFTYTYFEADNANQTHFLGFGDSDDINSNSLYYRLKLDAVTESTNLMTKPPYAFNYYEDGAKPNRHSAECDFWGYYNGNGAIHMIPATYIYPDLNITQLKNSLFQSVLLPLEMPNLPSKCIKFPGANRNAATTTVANIYSLKKITYPTGGYHTFTFEPNQFRIYDAGFSSGYTEMAGGGIRIKKIECYDPISNKTDSTTYSYTDSLGVCSGRILNFPLFANQQLLTFSDCKNDSAWITRYSTSPCDLGTTKGSHVGYKYVKVFNGKNGSEESVFDLPATFGVKMDCYDTLKKDFIYKRTIFNSLTFSPSKEYFLSEETGKSFVPFPPNPYFDWNRGQLLERKIFNSSNQLIRKEKNTYSIDSYQYIYSMAKGQISQPCTDYSIIFDFISKYNDICGWKYLSLQEIETYNPLVPNSPTIKEKTTYTYNDKVNRQVSKSQQLLSNGTINTTEMYYPTDFGNPAQPPYILNMLTKNIIDKPVEMVNYLETNGNKSYNKALLNVYDTQSRLIENWTLDLTSPSANFSFAKNLSTASQLNFDSRYSRKQSYTYNSAGKPATSIKENNPPVSYLWGYNNAYVVAEIVGVDITALSPALNADITKLENGDTTEQQRIRTSLPTVQINFYTYYPLIGLKTKYDVRGVKSTYSYDPLNRLQYIFDNNGKTLQSFDYNYKH